MSSAMMGGMGEPSEGEAYSDMERSAIQEIGNIVTSAIHRRVGERARDDHRYLTPTTCTVRLLPSSTRWAAGRTPIWCSSSTRVSPSTTATSGDRVHVPRTGGPRRTDSDIDLDTDVSKDTEAATF